MEKVLQKSKIVKGRRGTKPKRDVSIYALIIALKEYDERTLRGAEAYLARLIHREESIIALLVLVKVDSLVLMNEKEEVLKQC